MFLYNAVLERADANNPVLVCLIGAGKFGSMFLSQVPTTPGLEGKYESDDGSRETLVT